ncbi:MAG: HEAT repeat domain-containing protein [Myxococcota bacterium]
MVGALTLGGCDNAPSREPVPNPAANSASKGESAGADGEKKSDDEAAIRYLKIKDELDRDPDLAKSARFPKIRAELEEIANGSEAKPLRANAALLLGSLFDARGDSLKASGFYQHAAKLVPDDAGPHMALALASARVGDLPGAVKAQEKAAELDPDNLENWLALGELRLRAGDQEGSVQAYVDYERRRKGLIDGLTLHDDNGNYVVDVDERIGCANALAAAADQGTAVALIYALRSDPDAKVRAAIARVMGIQRLSSYLPVLKTQQETERDPETKEAVEWAITEIAREPVEVEATERPRLPDDDPRATEGEVPRAASAPVAPTQRSTIAPADEAEPAPAKAPADPSPAAGSVAGEGTAPSAG